MQISNKYILSFIAAVTVAITGNWEQLGLTIPFLFMHCDTMGGPVIKEAKKALISADITPLLKWIRKEDEPIVRDVFDKALSVRRLNSAASELADRLLFETLVRVHRMAEGAPYTGIKPEGTGISHAEQAADDALDNGSVDRLAEDIAEMLKKEIKNRFNRTLEKKAHADENVQSGREYVEAYVQYVHFVDGIHNMIAGHGSGHHH